VRISGDARLRGARRAQKLFARRASDHSTARPELGARNRSAIGVGGLRFSQFFAADQHAGRRLNADLYAVAAEADHGDTDLVVDDDFLSGLSRQDQHALFSLRFIRACFCVVRIVTEGAKPTCRSWVCSLTALVKKTG
jgi:hypothetical protein